jgi:hypothetical protein
LPSVGEEHQASFCLENDEPLIVAKMIDFLYGLDYDDLALMLKGVPPSKETILVR